jgi:hypothetical protein
MCTPRTTRPDLVARLVLLTNRQDAITALGAKTEREAKPIAGNHLTPATRADIIAALQKIERSKLKTYASVKVPGIDPDPYAGIPDTLLQSKISRVELLHWTDHIKRTTYASGNKYQPLPTHDEAWQAYSRIAADLYLDRQLARQIYYTAPPALTDADIIAAAAGYWYLMPHHLKQRAWRLIPEDERLAIRLRHPNDPAAAMQATRDYFTAQTTTQPQP